MLRIIKEIGRNLPYCITIVEMKKNGERPCVYANSKFFENTGYSPSFAIGRNLSFLQGNNTSKNTIDFMRKNFLKEKALIQDIINYKADNSPFLNRLLLLPLKSNNNKFYLGFQNDITKLKGLEYEEKSLTKIQDGEIKHFMNNTLSIIQGKYYKFLNEENDMEKKIRAKQSLSLEFEKILQFILEIDKLSEFENFEYPTPLSNKT